MNRLEKELRILTGFKHLKAFKAFMSRQPHPQEQKVYSFTEIKISPSRSKVEASTPFYQQAMEFVSSEASRWATFINMKPTCS